MGFNSGFKGLRHNTSQNKVHKKFISQKMKEEQDLFGFAMPQKGKKINYVTASSKHCAEVKAQPTLMDCFCFRNDSASRDDGHTARSTCSRQEITASHCNRRNSHTIFTCIQNIKSVIKFSY